MKLIDCLSDKVQHFHTWSNLACLLAVPFAFASFPAQACNENGPPPVPTLAERLSAADLVISGRIIAADNKNPPFIDLRLEVADRLKGRADRVVQVRAASHIPCGEGFHFLRSGQWWTFYLNRDKAKGTLFVAHVDAFCEKNAKPVPGGSPGTCSKVLAQAVELNGVRIDAGSTVAVGPERSIAAIQFARLQGRSTFAGIALPPGTAWFATRKQFDFPGKLAIGPASMKGRVELTVLPGSDNMRGTYYASLLPDHRGELTLHGAQVAQVSFTAPGWSVQEARLSKPGLMRGIHVADYVTFTPDGKFATLRSGRDQVVDGVRLKKCDNVDLVDGRVVAGKFYNPCAGR